MKNIRKFLQGEGVCYISEAGEEFTRQDFERMVARFAATHGLRTNEKVERLYRLVDWQHPATLLDEDTRDQVIWSEEEWSK